jgi:hypothetical protein
MSGILYFAGMLCLGLFMFIGKGILGIDVGVDISSGNGIEEFYDYIGYMSF